MSFTRRLTAGLPAVGVTVLAALALSGSPASATEVGQAAYPAVMTSEAPGATRGADGYGGTANEVPATTAPAATTPATEAPDDTTGTRGNPGYGGESPATSSPAPSSDVPGGTAAETVSPAPVVTTQGAGVSSGSELPVTGAPLAGTIALGGLLVAGGAAAVFYTRRRRNA